MYDDVLTRGVIVDVDEQHIHTPCPSADNMPPAEESDAGYGSAGVLVSSGEDQGMVRADVLADEHGSPVAAQGATVAAPAKKGWSVRGLLGMGKSEEPEFDPGFPVDPEYYERTGKPMPPYLDRFLAQFGRKKGPQMFKDMLKWRAERDIDNILKKPNENYFVFKEETPTFWFGKNKNNVWVQYELEGRVDPARLQKRGIKPEHVEYQIAFTHEVVQEVLDNGTRTGYMTVMDMAGFSVLKASSIFFLMLTKTYGETLYKYYPGSLERLVVVNAPMGGQTIYRILTNVLPASFAEKIQMLSEPSELLKYIDADQLPVQYGGTNTTPILEYWGEKAVNDFARKLNAQGGAPKKE